MTQYEQVDEKPVWLLMKRYSGGRIEIVGVYWVKETAQKVVASNLPSISDSFTLSLDEVKLFGSMIVTT